ncbi:MAG: hypothetical protein ABII71_00360 [Candidatus Micrarchaeota archaeon]
MMKMKMLQLMAFMLLLTSLSSLSFADDDDEDELDNFMTDTVDELQSEGDAFIDAAWAGGTAVGSVACVSNDPDCIPIFRAFSPGSCGTAESWNPSDPGTIVAYWLMPAGLMAILIIFGITIVYMAGQLLNLPQLIALAKDEAFQSGLTVVRVFFLILTLWASSMWYNIAAPEADEVYGAAGVYSMIDAAGAFSRYMVVEMVNSYSMLLMYNMVIHTLYSSTMWIGVTWRAMYSFNLGPVLKPLIDIIGMALQFLQVGIGEWMMHIIMLCMIKRWMWSLFIPIAMLLRAVPHTRGAGEALFALAVALAIIYPFMFLFDYEVHKLLSKNLVDGESAMSTFLNRTGIVGVAASVVVIMFLMAGVFIPFFLGGALNLAFELIRSAVYYVAIMSFFLPFLNIFVTLTAARETAKVFNVDVNFMSFLKVI